MSDKIKVLMVDDEDRFRTTTAKILDRKGFETIMAASGEEALEKISENPDVVILDVKMKGMDGHETLKRIKSAKPGLSVIMLTGHGALPSAQEALASGAFDYLTKPCDIDLLAAKIEDAYYKEHKQPKQEKCARDIMIPLQDYPTLRSDISVKQGIELIKKSSEEVVATDRIMDAGRRSILVFDSDDELAGILTPQCLLSGSRPGYLSAPKPSTADSIQYSAMFWTGLFTTQCKSLGAKSIRDIMLDPPPIVEDTANLMEVVETMHEFGKRRLAVKSAGKVVGVVREQEVFYELARIITGS